MKNLKLVAALLAIWPIAVFSQFSISGKITDRQTGESLAGAHVIVGDSYKSTISSSAGNFRITNLGAGELMLSVTYIGYQDVIKEIDLSKDMVLNIAMEPKAYLGDEVIITAVRAGEKSPTTYENVSREEIAEVNFGQDLPYLIETTPSTVVSSDAGAGIGYTGIRIRGTDITRINVTVNGIPLNDPESQGVFWVNMPDFATSVENIQIQRGVGTSTNGAAAFGASINIKTLSLQPDPYAEVSSMAGSFNTFKNNVSFGTGLINGKWSFDGRLSKITSDGYIDRATSDLKSFYFSGGWHGEKTMVKAVLYSGREKTYQAWWGVPKVRLENDMEGMQRYYDHWLFSEDEYEHMLNSDSRTYNYYTYKNETDNYQQDHYQLHLSHQFNKSLYMNMSAFYVYGRGYYEQMKKDDDFSDYGLPPVYVGNDTITSTNLVRQKWLDNDYYGYNFSLNYKKNKLNGTFGASWDNYDGRHFGKIIWAEFASNMAKDYEWYHNTGIKNNYSIFGKMNFQATEKLNVYADIQYRGVNYKINGLHDDMRDISQKHNFHFFNPKAGVYYDLNDNSSMYFSYAISNREPNRSNYRDADEGHQPVPERLYDYELGYNMSTRKYGLEANVFYMDYKDQLVMTGEISDVGAAIMTNVPGSYRAGIELIAGVQLFDKLKWDVNATYSQNKIKNFTEYVDNWDEGGQVKKDLGETDLAFSPDIIAGSRLAFKPVKGLDINLISKYVGRQYIDNTSNTDRSLDPYFVNNLVINYHFKTKYIKEVGIHFMVNNIFNEEYETFAWVYRYYLGGEYWNMDGYFPQAGTNFLGGITLKF